MLLRGIERKLLCLFACGHLAIRSPLQFKQKYMKIYHCCWERATHSVYFLCLPELLSVYVSFVRVFLSLLVFTEGMWVLIIEFLIIAYSFVIETCRAIRLPYVSVSNEDSQQSVKPCNQSRTFI